MIYSELMNFVPLNPHHSTNTPYPQALTALSVQHTPMHSEELPQEELAAIASAFVQRLMSAQYGAEQTGYPGSFMH